MANFLNDAAVKALFGTTEIPTPYTLKMPVEAVLANIRQRNPQCEVSAL
jgi:hypothetical protein